MAIIERDRLGGDCLNTGCVPSKALLRSARVIGETRTAGAVGIRAQAHVDFAAVMARMRARRADIAPHDSASRLAALGVDVFFGRARFTGRSTIAVGETPPNHPDGNAPARVSGSQTSLSFRKAVIATGSRPAIPPVPGLAGVPFVTNETIFDLREQPRDLLVLGGGPIGCELAQAFARLGTHVTLIQDSPQVLPREDEDAAALVSAALSRDGVDVRRGLRVTSAARERSGVRLAFDGGELTAGLLLVATGRVPNIDGLDLEAAGVAAGSEGVHVSDRMRTTNRRIYASGDVASRYKFTHAADALSRIVVQNALFFGRKRASALVVPWCTFTDPEVAHVGVSSRDAPDDSAAITIPLRDVDRAVVDEEVDGFVRVHHRRGRIIGATIVAPAAGEMIATVAYAMQSGHTLERLSAAVFPYPTRALALRQAGDAYRRTRLTPRARTALEYYFRLGRRFR